MRMLFVFRTLPRFYCPETKTCSACATDVIRRQVEKSYKFWNNFHNLWWVEKLLLLLFYATNAIVLSHMSDAVCVGCLSFLQQPLVALKTMLEHKVSPPFPERFYPVGSEWGHGEGVYKWVISLLLLMWFSARLTCLYGVDLWLKVHTENLCLRSFSSVCVGWFFAWVLPYWANRNLSKLVGKA